MAMNRKRRGRAEGSIFERADGRWSAEVSLGYDGHGKRVRKTVYGADKGEVAAKLRKLQTDHDAGRLVETERLTVGEYLTRWLNNAAKNKVGVQTWERYRQLVELYLVPILGGVKLSKLAPLHVEQCYAAMERGAPDRKKAEAPTRKGIDRLFRDKGFELHPTMEMDNVETIKRAVEMGLGVSVLPLPTVQHEVANGTLIAKPFADEIYTRPIGILVRKGKYLARASQAVLDSFKLAAREESAA